MSSHRTRKFNCWRRKYGTLKQQGRYDDDCFTVKSFDCVYRKCWVLLLKMFDFRLKTLDSPAEGDESGGRNYAEDCEIRKAGDGSS